MAAYPGWIYGYFPIFWIYPRAENPVKPPKSLILGTNPRMAGVGMGIAKSPTDELSFCLGHFP
jgi:hypothetical protein